ncbi:MAG: hypothetical protein Q4G02_01730 [bacterium]|nr:hypothetical protein [bacterium]
MAEKKAKKSNAGIIAGVVVVLLIAVAVYFFRVKKVASPDAPTALTNISENITNNIVGGITEGKLAKYLLHDPFFMRVELKESGMTMDMTFAKKGETFYLAVPTFGIKTLSDESRSCQINDEAKTYSCQALTEAEDEALFDDEDLAYLTQKPVIGSETIDGVTYETETYDDNLIGYFEGDAWRYYRAGDDETLVKVLEYQENADNSLFEIPAGYTETSNPMPAAMNIDLSQIEGMDQIDPALLEQIQQSL